MRPPPSGTSVMCTQPVDSGTSASVPARAAVGARRQRRPRRGCRSSARRRRCGRGRAAASRRRRRAASPAPRTKLPSGSASVRGSPERTPSGPRSSGRNRTTHSSCRPPGWAVWKRPGAPVAGSVKITGFCSDRSGSSDTRSAGLQAVGAGRQRGEVDEDVRAALQRSAEPGAGERAVGQPLQERRMVVHDRRRRGRPRPGRARPARFVRSSVPRSRPGSFPPPPCVGSA